MKADPSRIMRPAGWLRRGLLTLSVALPLGLGGTYLWLAEALPQTSGTLRLDGIDAAVEVVRDKDGVPYIFAQSESDAYFALGLAHAQDRLWQMEMNRRVPAGRLAEIFGKDVLGVDRFMRTLGIRRLIEDGLDGLAPDVRQALDAYAAGVNAWLAHRTGPLPPEFLVLGIEPEPWVPADSLGWGGLMSLQLGGNWRDELLRARLSQGLTPAQLATLYPPYPGEGPVTLATRAELLRDLPLDRLWAALPALAAHVTASNEWVVSGAHTATGAPLLANDLHLGFSAPGLWYLARIEAPGLAVAGATVPGVPLTIAGHNDAIAWGLTTTNGDTQDLFIEQLDPDDPARYLTPAGSRPFRQRTEVIRVKGDEDLALTVRESRHGPILDDILDQPQGVAGPGKVLALSATFLSVENRTAEALYRLNRAGDWPEFVAALKAWHAPQQNVVYADKAGNIGFYVPARVPQRKAGDGFMPVPGWSGAFDWTGYVPFEELPHALNPPQGRIVNANNKIVSASYPHFLGRDWEVPYRARRIEQMLAAAARPSLDQMAAMQADTVSLMAREVLPLLLDYPPATETGRQAVAMLRRWDGRMDRTKPEPLIFNAWLLALSRALFADELGDRFDDYLRLRPLVLRRMLTADRGWCDDVTTTSETESCADVVARSLDGALARITAAHGGDMAAWRWGDEHRAAFRHRLFERVPLARYVASRRIETDGGDYTVNRGTPSLTDGQEPFSHVHGAGFRVIYDLADLKRSRFMQATGQSGNPLSSHYMDLNRRWRDFDYLDLGADRERLLAEGGERLVLVPARAKQR